MFPIGSLEGINTSQLTDSDTGLSAVVRYDADGRPISVDSTQSYIDYLNDIKNEESIDEIMSEQAPINDTLSWLRTSPTDAKVYTSGKAPMYIAGIDPALGEELVKIREKTVDFDDLPEEFQKVSSKLGKSKN
jgi:hypothetical protein